VNLTIDRIGHLGDGIAHGPNGAVFVQQMLPGEVVSGELSGDRLMNPKILTPSVDRVKPPCPHARACGGCLMQHASDAFVANWKEGIILGALEGQGLAAPMRPILTSPPKSRRRATLAGKRTKSGAMIGFHGRASDTLVQIPNCQLLHPDLMATFPALEALVVTGGSRMAELALTVTRMPGGADVSVTGGKPLDGDLRLALARLVEQFGLSRLTWDNETVALRATPLQTFGRARVPLPPGAFLQATDHGEASLLNSVNEAVGSAGRIADLFAGAGTFALPLAERAEVYAVEGDAAMTAALDKGARQAEGLKSVTVETRDLFRRPLDGEELKRFDAVVIDPPRAGADAQVRQLARSAVQVIAYVSCNPSTFARDARVLVESGFRLDWVQGVDQFRWSAHVEMVARLSR
jgi:23S rRNA (uracil1939-C5)-methyltransferase